MEKNLIAALIISFIIITILFLRERRLKIASERCNDYYEKERASFQLEIKKKNEKISDLKKENTTLGKKNNKFFMAEIRYRFVFLSQKKIIRSLLKEKERLKNHLLHYEEIKIEREKQYTNLN